MASTTATTSLVTIFQEITTGMAMYLTNASIYLIVFAFMLGGFTTLMLILGIWKTR